MPELDDATAPLSARTPAAGCMGKPPQTRSGRGPQAGPPDMRLPAGFLAICQPLARSLARRRVLFIAEPDAPNVHALRGAARRLQAAVSLFDAVLHPRDARWMRRELNALTGRLGRLRDLDVFLSRLADLPKTPDGPEAQAEAAVLREAARSRRAACEKAVAALRSARATILVDGVEAWLFEAAADLSPKASLSANARPALQALHDDVRGAGRHLTRLGAERRHALRSRVKILRYSAEAIAQMDGVAAAHPYLAALTALGHQLGDLNDDAVGARLEKKLSGRAGVSLSGRAHSAHRQDLAAAWAAFTTAVPSWAPDARRGD